METSGGREAEFIGAITASATHEMRNVLAIVKESAGLIEDLVRASSRGGATLQGERILKATGRIDAQVARGAEIVTHLNRVAHSMDDTGARADLAQEAREVAFHAQRLARSKRQSVEPALQDHPLWLTGDSLHVQMGLWAAVAFCLGDLPEEAALTVGVEGAGSVVRAEITASVASQVPLPCPTESPGWGRLEALLASLGIGLQAKDEGGYGVRLLYEGGG